MYTLSIEHPITDFPTWEAAFDRFSEARAAAGVRSHRVRRPLDDDGYLVIELEFESSEAAEGFRQFLMTTIWADPGSSPALAGRPTARILEPVGPAA